jgi:two-component sensor histidine kinase
MADPDTGTLQQALAEERALQREAHHRIKNTLQLISSLIMLQGRRAPDESARQALRSLQQRVAAVSLAHRHVSQEEGAERVELSAMVRELASDVAASSGRDGVRIELDLEPLDVSARDAAPLALLVAEAVSNALRHAFPDGRGGAVRVALSKAGGELLMEVSDDGAGAPEPPPKGFGAMMMQLLAQQLRGRLEMGPAQPGFRVSVTAPMDERAAPGV